MEIRPTRFRLEKRNNKKFSNNYFIVFNSDGWDSTWIDGMRSDFAREIGVCLSDILGYYLGLGFGCEWAIFFVADGITVNIEKLRSKLSNRMRIERDIWDFSSVYSRTRDSLVHIKSIGGYLSDFINIEKIELGGWIDGVIRWANNGNEVLVYHEYGFAVMRKNNEINLPLDGKFFATPFTLGQIMGDIKNEQTENTICIRAARTKSREM